MTCRPEVPRLTHRRALLVSKGHCFPFDSGPTETFALHFAIVSAGGKVDAALLIEAGAGQDIRCTSSFVFTCPSTAAWSPTACTRSIWPLRSAGAGRPCWRSPGWAFRHLPQAPAAGHGHRQVVCRPPTLGAHAPGTDLPVRLVRPTVLPVLPRQTYRLSRGTAPVRQPRRRHLGPAVPPLGAAGSDPLRADPRRRAVISAQPMVQFP